ncbi:NPCBM-associated, NEW3 domain of alpha-galactosidase [uncultured archaeon]|nr:NPCBM-associated, NEW3 domain of alpha-galactosidase [uncultured archaeon]
MKSRRGISTVVGAVFAIIALGTTVGYITYSMTTLDNYNQSVLAKNQQNADIANEKFQVSSATFANNKLNVTILDTGSLPVNITKIWISNQTASSCTTYSCNINYITNKVVSPGLTVTNIGQSMSGSLNLNKPYNVKLVSSRGNMLQFNVNSVGSAPINIQLLALPATVSSGFKTELTMTVTNNSTGILTNIVPSLSAPTYTGSGTTTCTAGLANPANYNTLPSGGTAIFKWDVTVTGGVAGDTCQYTASLNNGFANNNAQATLTLTQVTFVQAAATTPLNIKLYALPNNLPAKFHTQLVMVVANNSTGTVGTTANPITPVLSAPSGTATCTAGSVSPTSYKNVAPGNTVTFTWDVTVDGLTTNSCTYTASLASPYNGYSTSPSTTITLTDVTFASTTLAQNTGILSLNYTTFRWYQSGSSWNNGWEFPTATGTAFKMNVTNNNYTGTFWISKYTQLFVTRASGGNNFQFFIVNTTSLNPLTNQKYDGCNGVHDYCKSIAPGSTGTIYFSAGTLQGTTAGSVQQGDQYAATILLYGKFTTGGQSGSGNQYGQTLPFIATLSP